MEAKRELEQLRSHLRDERVAAANRVKSKVVKILRDFLEGRDFVELMPVIASSITDPLSSPETTIFFQAYGSRLQLTKSMIFHKQMAMLTYPRIFIFSPNFRLEPEDRSSTGRHLVEFVQLDLEVREASREDVMRLAEEMLSYLFERIREEAREELEFFGRSLPELRPPFPTITYSQAWEEFGPQFETELSKRSHQPIWVLDFPYQVREFYYREHEGKEVLRDFDLLYPEGFGEAISGGEREWRADRTRDRIRRKGIDESFYALYLQLLEQGIPPSAGFGIGIERLTRFICGVKDISLCRLFPKLPGRVAI